MITALSSKTSGLLPGEIAFLFLCSRAFFAFCLIRGLRTGRVFIWRFGDVERSRTPASYWVALVLVTAMLLGSIIGIGESLSKIE
jgi:hypothetical protein